MELIKNTYVGVHFGTHKLYNDYLYISGDLYGRGTWNSPVLARNFGINLKYEISLWNSFKVTPFVGYSISYINQPTSSHSTFRIRSRSSSTSKVYENDVLISENTVRDSMYSSTEFVTNTFSGISVGGELTYHFKNRLGFYFSYALFHSSKYYTVQYGEYHSTAIPVQKANISFGKSGHFYQIGLKYHIGNL